MRLFRLVDELEAIFSGVNFLVRDDTIPSRIDVAFDTNFLFKEEHYQYTRAGLE